MNIDNSQPQQQEQIELPKFSLQLEDTQDSIYPNWRECYQGFYVDFDPVDEAAQRVLANPNGFVGSQLTVRICNARLDSNGDVITSSLLKDSLLNSPSNELPDDEILSDCMFERRAIVLRENTLLAVLPTDVSNRIDILLRQNWKLTCVLSLVTFSNNQGGFFGQAAVMMYNPRGQFSEALSKFIDRMAKRIGNGDHPRLMLSQEEFAKIIESTGEWNLTGFEPISHTQKGRAKYKSRKSSTERIFDYSLRHKTGCGIASTIFLLALIALVAFIIWKLFFG